MNPLNRFGSVSGKSVTSKLHAPSITWQLIDEKFGLHAFKAEQHRVRLQLEHVAPVKKVLADMHVGHWQFFKKVSLK